MIPIPRHLTVVGITHEVKRWQSMPVPGFSLRILPWGLTLPMLAWGIAGSVYLVLAAVALLGMIA